MRLHDGVVFAYFHETFSPRMPSDEVSTSCRSTKTCSCIRCPSTSSTPNRPSTSQLNTSKTSTPAHVKHAPLPRARAMTAVKKRTQLPPRPRILLGPPSHPHQPRSAR
ncbi:hypothetical protein HBI56_054490 [Parastagonospora nodorum]|uniref:Uncharacterized protein n=1 Tax=Phaeosphaeria nodorum (strain SN15 / ATCC MYA-4574 / FGSC 10173) TaxID=321614 RepID=A0A7U2NR53_PHANO|nr:hypothetical protein HBH56_097630 [Parastagonospora nodorum]QRD07333.1 hypothetical protein JI435_308450 [Parastagonospora nodorum SN15]KAH3930598.1 hypothetical protein HBH54_111960 [Parastagonospora nodorum]KAH3945062.1 hypothetical protein HBH53_147480 [Parastagonospora nodorum]KAH3966905.1 hypothetical protein HBH51_138880 [Parastagonospora nodorum]